MEVARILRVLWKRKWWVLGAGLTALAAAVPVAYHVSLFPPHLRAKQSAYAVASTAVLVDRQMSSLSDTSGDLSAMSSRASAYAQLMRSGPVLQAAASAAGLQSRQIATAGPFSGGGNGQLPGEARANQLIGESSPNRMVFDAASPNAEIPVITIYAQAPTTRLAEQMANGAATGLASYVSSEAAFDRVAPGNRVVIRQLTQAKGAIVASGAGKTAAAIMLIAVWAILCLLIITLPQVRERWREVSWEERLAAAREPTAGAAIEPAAEPEPELAFGPRGQT